MDLSLTFSLNNYTRRFAFTDVKKKSFSNSSDKAITTNLLRNTSRSQLKTLTLCCSLDNFQTLVHLILETHSCCCCCCFCSLDFAKAIFILLLNSVGADYSHQSGISKANAGTTNCSFFDLDFLLETKATAGAELSGEETRSMATEESSDWLDAPPAEDASPTEAPPELAADEPPPPLPP